MPRQNLGVKCSEMYKYIRRMVHCICTAFGDSKGTYGGDDIGNWEHEPQGILQGNASGPHIWTVVNLVVFNILRHKGHGSQFCTALSKEMFVLIGFSYVDDCDLIQTGQDIYATGSGFMDRSSRSYRRSARTLKKLVLPCGLQAVTRTVESLRPTLPFNLINTRQNQSDN